jgi:hypothetical protein
MGSTALSTVASFSNASGNADIVRLLLATPGIHVNLADKVIDLSPGAHRLAFIVLQA